MYATNMLLSRSQHYDYVYDLANHENRALLIANGSLTYRDVRKGKSTAFLVSFIREAYSEYFLGEMPHQRT